MTRSVVVAGRAQDPLHLLAHARAQVRVERGEGLVEQHDLGLDRERPGERDALLLAAGELVGVAALESAEPDELEQLVHSVAGACLRGSPKPMFAATVRCGKRPPSCGT